MYKGKNKVQGMTAIVVDSAGVAQSRHWFKDLHHMRVWWDKQRETFDLLGYTLEIIIDPEPSLI